MISAHLGLFANLFAMKKLIILHFEIEGHHAWKDAPENIWFLSKEHRHLFTIRIGMNVEHNDREKEIFLQQQLFQEYLKTKYEKTHLNDYTYHDFGNMSCEDIAEEIIKLDDSIHWVEVLEDNKGGARIER
ncbi:MAG: hypothetical protein Unbinned2716contig1000_25 [Prokaryotic dsDNA virus sp.]|nr:MAG: hypothetical protein Unbinned2716contig1000_25 [Prokaryotic dsDNA virus sp.]|tara:strand:+ start:16292 stop:16684 length:393 start_codon:yes stop_codon:yes gene_type:complete